MKIIIYFVSGLSFHTSIDKEKFDELVCTLKNCWSETVMFCEDSSINFSHVTHYEIVEENEKKQDVL